MMDLFMLRDKICNLIQDCDTGYITPREFDNALDLLGKKYGAEYVGHIYCEFVKVRTGA